MNRVVDPITNICTCDSGFYSTGAALCSTCNYDCKNCINTAVKCTSCNLIGTNRSDHILSNNTCPCIEGYYDVGLSVCAKCDISCKGCL